MPKYRDLEQVNLALRVQEDGSRAIEVVDDVGNRVANSALGAQPESPTFTGDPNAPTASVSDDDASIATTAFVKDALAVQHDVDNSTYARVFAVPDPTGVRATDTANALATIALAVAAGGGVVRWQPGTYLLGQAMPTRANVTHEGYGMGTTILKPNASHCWDQDGTALAPIVSAHWRDMTWDGGDISTAVTYKGQYSIYLSNCTWTRVECKDFTATGFGSDYLRGCRYAGCIATGNGRGQTVGDPGMSGFGIGTGAFQVEDTIVEGCTATGNLSYGIFFESQSQSPATTYASRGVRIIGNHCEGNGWGISDAGCEGAVIEGNTCNSNTYDGITVNSGSGAGAGLGVPGSRGVISGNTCLANGQDGIHLDWSKNSLSALENCYQAYGNTCTSNTRNGIRVDASKWSSDKLRGLVIKANQVYKNAATGIYVTTTVAGGDGGGAVHDLCIEGNQVYANGTAAGSDRDGIRVLANTTRLRIKGNNCSDWQGVKTQGVGVKMDATYTHTDADVRNNDAQGNLTAAMTLSGTWAGNSIVNGNRGYQPGWSSIDFIGGSPLTYTAGPHVETVYIAGGASTAVKLTPYGGSQATILLVTGDAAVSLDPGDAMELTWGTVPTSVKTVKKP